MQLRCLRTLLRWIKTLPVSTIRMSRFPTRFSAHFPHYYHILKSDIRVSWSLIVVTLYAAISSRLVNIISGSGVGQGAFPRLSFQYGAWCTVIWGFLSFLCEELSRIEFWRRVIINATGSDGRKWYNSVFCVTEPRKLCENAINSVWQSTGVYTPTIFFHFSGGVPVNFGGVCINASRRKCWAFEECFAWGLFKLE